MIDFTIPVPTATATSIPSTGSDALVGIVYRPANNGLIPFLRASVTLVDVATSEIIAVTTFDPVSGIYIFQNLPLGTYSVSACGSLGIDDGIIEYAGWRTAITLPYSFPVNIYTDSSFSCPN